MGIVSSDPLDPKPDNKMDPKGYQAWWQREQRRQNNPKWRATKHRLQRAYEIRRTEARKENPPVKIRKRDFAKERQRRLQYQKDRPWYNLARWQARRARLANVPYEYISLRVVYRKDGGVCQLCGQAVVWGLKHPKNLMPSLDHVVPLSKGGPHTYANIQLAHLGCNSRKGARV